MYTKYELSEVVWAFLERFDKEHDEAARDFYEGELTEIFSRYGGADDHIDTILMILCSIKTEEELRLIISVLHTFESAIRPEET